MRLDPRLFSQKSYASILALKSRLDRDDLDKASSLIQGLVTYISTWGLHRLSGDRIKFGRPDNVEDTNYKSIVYGAFLDALRDFSEINFNCRDPESLIGGQQDNGLQIREYLSLNKLAIRLAREWSFWSPSVLETPAAANDRDDSEQEDV